MKRGGQVTELPIGFSIKQINDKMLAYADASLKKYDLTFSQVQVLDFLYFHGGKATQKEIERHLGVSHPAVVGLVNRMVQAGFLYCFVDEADKRNKVVCITEKAKAVETKAEKDRRASETLITEGMSKEEILELQRLLMKVYQNLGGKTENKRLV